MCPQHLFQKAEHTALTTVRSPQETKEAPWEIPVTPSHFYSHPCTYSQQVTEQPHRSQMNQNPEEEDGEDLLNPPIK